MSTRAAVVRQAGLRSAAVGLAVVGLVACHGRSAPSGGGSAASTGGARPTSSAPAAGSAHTIAVKDFSFEPGTLTVPVGTTVTWKFEDDAQHTVDFTKPKILSKPLHDDQTYSYKFGSAGTYDYVCSIHQYMHGTVVVK